MSATPGKPVLWRTTAWTLVAALLLPTIVACTAPPPSSSAPPPRAAAVVARLDGMVVDERRAVPGREPGWVVVTRDGYRQDAYAGFELHRGDFVETGPRAHAVIRYPSGTEVLMRPNSGGRIASVTEFFGEVFVKVRELFSVDTTFVKAGARGTAYLVRTYAGGTTGILVVDGAVEVGSTTGAWPSVTIGAGTMTLAHPRAPQPVAASIEELSRTREWVERVEQLVPPRGGVSTGAVVGAVAIAALIAAMAASSSRDRDRSRETPQPQPDPRRDSPPPPRPPDAPRALNPGVAQGARPTLDCRRGVTLRWSAVADARDYAVALDVERNRSWSTVRVAPTTAPQASVAAAALAYENRWSVRARGAGDGPSSQTLYFRCDFSGVR
jgi:hypothetical protein